jgi:hypothetical protein
MALFGLDVSEFIAILALCVAVATSVLTAVTFSKAYRRNRKSEQIKIARKIRDDINLAATKYARLISKNVYPSEGPIEDKRKWMEELLNILIDLLVGVRYFTYLVEQKEIGDKGVLYYYKVAMLIDLGIMQYELTRIEEMMKSDPMLAATLTTDLPSAIDDILPNLPRLSRELSRYMFIWSNIRPSWKIRIKSFYFKRIGPAYLPYMTDTLYEIYMKERF